MASYRGYEAKQFVLYLAYIMVINFLAYMARNLLIPFDMTQAKLRNELIWTSVFDYIFYFIAPEVIIMVLEPHSGTTNHLLERKTECFWPTPAFLWVYVSCDSLLEQRYRHDRLLLHKTETSSPFQLSR